MTDHERQILNDLLWEYKKTIPRGTPFPQIVVDAENILWGWAWPVGHVPSTPTPEPKIDREASLYGGHAALWHSNYGPTGGS